MRAETRVILNNSFSENDKKEFKKFSKIIQNKYMDKNSNVKMVCLTDHNIFDYSAYLKKESEFSSLKIK